MVSCRKVVASHTATLTDSRLAKAKSALQPFKAHGGAISLDYGNRVYDYLIVMCHFIRAGPDGWELQTLPVGFEKSDADSKTAADLTSAKKTSECFA